MPAEDRELFVTSNMLEYFHHVSDLTISNAELSKKFQHYSQLKNDKLGKGCAISFKLLKQFLDVLNHPDNRGVFGRRVYLHELIAGAEIVIPELKLPERNPELEERIQRLKAQLEESEYQRITANVAPKSYLSEGIMPDMKTVNFQLIAVFNFVLTVSCSFAFGYKAVEYSLSAPSVFLQVFVGLFLAIIVAIADIYFLMKKLD